MSDRHTLYRFFGTADELLYAGITCSTPRRIREHSQKKAWWSEVRRATFEHFDSRDEALEAERLAIRTERPVYNKAHNSKGRNEPEVTHEPVRTDNSGLGLVSRFFHMEADSRGWQGRVLENLGSERFLVQLYSWLDGTPSDQVIVSLEDMLGWTFYDDAEDWRYAVEHGALGIARERLFNQTEDEDDPLTKIHPHLYYEALTGKEVASCGETECLVCGCNRCLVFENHDAGWWCAGCNYGGQIYELACHIWGIKKDRSDFLGSARWLGLRSHIMRRILRHARVEDEDQASIQEGAKRFGNVCNSHRVDNSGESSERADVAGNSQ